MFGARNIAEWPVVVPIRAQPDGAKQRLLMHMPRVRDKRHTHPPLDGFVPPVDAAHRSARAEAENKRESNRRTEGCDQDASLTSSLRHDSNINDCATQVNFGWGLNVISGLYNFDTD